MNDNTEDEIGALFIALRQRNDEGRTREERDVGLAEIIRIALDGTDAPVRDRAEAHLLEREGMQVTLTSEGERKITLTRCSNATAKTTNTIR